MGKPIDLAPKFVPGTTVRYVSEGLTQLHMRVDLLDLDETHLVRKETGMSLTTVAVDSNGATEVAWVLHYVAIQSEGAIPGIAERLDYDSRNPQATRSPLASLFASLLEKPITLRLDPAGRVQSVTGLANEPTVGLLDALARDFISPAAIAQLPMFVTVPAPRPAKVRSTWTESIPLAMPLGAGAVTLDQTFTFERMSPRRKTAQISMQGDASAGVPSGSGGTVDVRQSVARGAFVWDFAAGNLQEAETHLELETAFNSVLGPMELTQSLTTSVRRAEASESARRKRPNRDREK